MWAQATVSRIHADKMTPRAFSLAHLTLLDVAPPELVRIAAAAGYEYVGLRTIPFGLPGEPFYELHRDPALLRDTRAALAGTGVRILDIELARITADRDPAVYVPAMEAAAALGATHVLSSIWVPDRSLAIDSFGRLCDLAKPLALTVDLEFVSTTDWSTLAGARDVIAAAARDNAGLMVDTMHFHRAGTSLEELDAIPAAWFNFVHIADDRKDVAPTLEEARRRMRDERLYPGEGAIDIAEILRHLPDGVVCAIELPHRDRRRALGPEAFARECLNRTKQHLEAVF
jgi:sugar phosphate isomerase/epimerase